MAEAKQQYTVRLYDAEGMYVGSAEHDEDLMLAQYRDSTLSAGGKTYVWNQRNGQWREASGAIKIGGVEKPEDNSQAEAQKSPPAAGPTTSKA